jgi:DNA helicase II / ATP-dependent DNA helicase PcrA
MSENLKYKTTYERLNPQQKKAVDQIEGPVMVMAGPGTGKTQVLATRIGKILQDQDIAPENILALTFTDAAAKNMRERVVSMIGVAGYYVNIMTFHSFADEIISQNPEHFPVKRNSRPLSDLEKYELFENIISNSNLEHLRPPNDPFHYVSYIITRISELKKEYIDPDKFEEIFKADFLALQDEPDELPVTRRLKSGEIITTSRMKLNRSKLNKLKDIEKQRDLHTLYVKYESELKNRNRYDFDDMIVFVVRALENSNELLAQIQEQYQYILIDEFQDTNRSQAKVVELILEFWGDQANIFVVGDPHQSIYRFQGASTENMVGFVQRYPEALVVTLKTGYRCQQSIYDAVHRIISKNTLQFENKNLDQQLNQKLQSSSDELSNSKNHNYINLFEAESSLEESFFVYQQISNLFERGVAPEEIAVLYRNHKDAADLSEVFAKQEIPFTLGRGKNIFDNILIDQLLKLFQVVQDVARGEESEILFEVMLYDWIGLDRLSVFRLSRLAGNQRKSLIETLDENQEDFPNLVEFKNKLLDWVVLDSNMIFTQWFSLIINAESDGKNPAGFSFMNYILDRPLRHDHLLAINALYNQIKDFVSQEKNFSLSHFLQAIKLMKEHGVAITTQAFENGSGNVCLSSVHSAKGKEWPYVFLINVVDKKWGNTTNRNKLPLPDSIMTYTDISKKERNEDERRLFYVALTRASREVFVSYPKTKINGNKLKDQVVSMFMSEAFEDGKYEKLASSLGNSEKLTEEMLTKTAVGTNYSQQEREFFAELVSDFVLSVTSLDQYLQDPAMFVENSLLRVPRAKLAFMSLGTATHSALEMYYRRVIDNKPASSYQEFFDQFKITLESENLSKFDFEERLKQGAEILDFYYQNVLNLDKSVELRALQKPIAVERHFGGKTNKVILLDSDQEIRLSGRVDRIDLLDKKNKLVRFVDYKTGTPKSDNQIKGESSTNDYSERELSLPETIRGRYHRQLVFYQLLAELDKSFDYQVAESQFDFIQPQKTSVKKHVVRSYTISDQAVADLKNLIVEVVREIKELKFLE